MKGATLKYSVILLLSAIWVWSGTGLVRALQPSFAVQIASHQDISLAEAEVKGMQSRGYPAFTKPFTLEGKGTWHRVFVGPYGAQNEATAAALRLRSQGLIQDFLIRSVSVQKSGSTNSGGNLARPGSEAPDHLEKIQAYAPPATPPSPIARQWTSEDQFGAKAPPLVETRTSPPNQDQTRRTDHGATKELFKNELKKKDGQTEPITNSGLSPAWRVEGGHGQRVTVIKTVGKSGLGNQASTQGAPKPAAATSNPVFDPSQGTLVPYMEGGRTREIMDYRYNDYRQKDTAAGVNWVTDFDLKQQKDSGER